MTARQHVRLEWRGRVSWLTLDRPKMNALDGDLRGELIAALDEAIADDVTRVVVLTGAGRAFCAGADIRYLESLFGSGDERGFAALVEGGRELATRIRSAPKPVIAAVNGAAAGGGASLALMCDLRIAAESASIGQAFIRIGLHPDYGSTWLLPRLVGPSRALELMWTGRQVPADEALRLGLFDRVVPDGRLEDEVTEFTDALAEAAPDAVAGIKASIYAVEDAGIAAALDRELARQLELFRGPDAREGLRAFLEKRTPRFTGSTP